MKYISEYRDKELIDRVARQIEMAVERDYTFMEVCGGHTAAIRRFGIPSLLPANIKLISGPGCPVCVTSTGFVDRIVTCAQMDDVIITTFGDLMRVPGSGPNLEEIKSKGADVRIVFSGLDALDIALQNPRKRVVFPGIGFETTAPGTAVTIIEAAAGEAGNFFVLSAHKVMPPVMRALLENGIRIDGFICPGHVATITGYSAFEFIPYEYNKACVITGFEPLDLLQAILMLVNQVNSNRPSLETEYKRAVLPEGNSLALEVLSKVFEPCDAEWRGFGIIPLSGLALRREYEKHDAGRLLKADFPRGKDNPACICGDILRGLKTPSECPLFSETCTPANPVGACMVSAEGACNSFYKYTLYE